MILPCKLRLWIVKLALAATLLYITVSSPQVPKEPLLITIVLTATITSLLLSRKFSLLICLGLGSAYAVSSASLPPLALIASIPYLSSGADLLDPYLYALFTISVMYYGIHPAASWEHTLITCIETALAFIYLVMRECGMRISEEFMRAVVMGGLITLAIYLLGWLTPVIPSVVVFGAATIVFLLALDKAFKRVSK